MSYSNRHTSSVVPHHDVVEQTTFPVPLDSNAQRCTSHDSFTTSREDTCPWPRFTTRKSLPVSNNSTLEQWCHDSKSIRDGSVTRLVDGASSLVFHVIRSVHSVAASSVTSRVLRHSTACLCESPIHCFFYLLPSSPV